MEIIILESVIEKLSELNTVLFKKGYFSYKESAENYVNAIIDFIYTIPEQKAKPTRDKKMGKWYCRFKANSNTSWYITFDTDGDLIIVRNIFNNHTREYPNLISNL